LTCCERVIDANPGGTVMRRRCGRLALVLCLLLVGCGKKAPSPESLPKATFVGLTIRRVPDPTNRPTDVLYEFRLTLLDRYDWKGKALRMQLVTEDEPPLYSLASLLNPGDEVTITARLDKKIPSDEVNFTVHWGRSKDGKMQEEFQPVHFPEGTESGRSVPILGTIGRHVKQATFQCGSPGKPVPFDPDEGIDLLTVGEGDTAYRLRVWAPLYTGEED